MDSRELYRRIGSHIKSRRKSLKKTQAQLAPLLGISRASLANIETGRQNVLVHQLYVLAEKLQLSVHDLLPQLDDTNSPDAWNDLPMPPNLKQEEKGQIARLLASTPARAPISPKEESREPKVEVVPARARTKTP